MGRFHAQEAATAGRQWPVSGVLGRLSRAVRVSGRRTASLGRLETADRRTLKLLCGDTHCVHKFSYHVYIMGRGGLQHQHPVFNYPCVALIGGILAQFGTCLFPKQLLFVLIIVQFTTSDLQVDMKCSGH